MMRIGIFGGTFNPPHMGHVNAAKAAAKALGLKKVYFIPTGDPPHKKIPEGSATAEQRMAMTTKAAAMVPGGQALDIELNRQGPSYTVDTLEQLKQMHPDDELWLIVGTDMLLSLESWHEPDRIVEMASIAVVPRMIQDMKIIKDAVPGLEQSLGARVQIIDTQPLAVSSTDIRRGKKLPRIPSSVDRYIRKYSLYGLDAEVDNIRQRMRKRLSEKRYHHALGVEKMASALAKAHGVDELTARKAALVHDVAKEMSKRRQSELRERYSNFLQRFEEVSEHALHAETGALIAECEYKLPPDICDAVRYHTTGRVGMSKLEKIIFVADKIEEGRQYEDIAPVRRLAFRDLDAAAATVMRQTLDALKRQGKKADPRTQEALNELNSIIKARNKG